MKSSADPSIEASTPFSEEDKSPEPPEAAALGITYEEEQALWRGWIERGDSEARARLIHHHLAFARMLAARLYAKRYHDQVEFDEYLQLASMGLIEAVDRYDPEAGARFRTYAGKRIVGAVLNGLDALSEQQQQIRFRRRLMTDRVNALKSCMRVGGHEETLLQELAEVGIGLALGYLLEGTGMMDGADVEQNDGAYKGLELRQLRDRVRYLVRHLTQREQDVITLHYMQERPFEDVARTLGITKGRVSQLHQQGLARLRQWITQEGDCDVAW